jgi:hypothetical protein
MILRPVRETGLQGIMVKAPDARGGLGRIYVQIDPIGLPGPSLDYPNATPGKPNRYKLVDRGEIEPPTS